MDLAEMWSPVVYSNNLSLSSLVQMVHDAGGHKAATCVIKILSVGLSTMGKEKTGLISGHARCLPAVEGAGDKSEIRAVCQTQISFFLLT